MIPTRTGIRRLQLSGLTEMIKKWLKKNWDIAAILLLFVYILFNNWEDISASPLVLAYIV